jgi:hypothetical protein
MTQKQNKQESHNICKIYAINSLRMFKNLGTALKIEIHFMMELGK